MALSPSNNTLYVGGGYPSINGAPVSTTERDTTVSMLAISTVDGSVNAERFVPELVLGDLVIVGHHGVFLGTLTNPFPPEAVVSIDPLNVKPFKLHSFRMDPASARLIPEQTWSINGTFGVCAIEASEDSIWIAGDLRRAGADSWDVKGLDRFPAF